MSFKDKHSRKLEKLKNFALSGVVMASSLFAGSCANGDEKAPIKDMLYYDSITATDISGHTVVAHKSNIHLFDKNTLKLDGTQITQWAVPDLDKSVLPDRSGEKTYIREANIGMQGQKGAGETILVEVYEDGVFKDEPSLAISGDSVAIVGDNSTYAKNLVYLRERHEIEKRRAELHKHRQGHNHGRYVNVEVTAKSAAADSTVINENFQNNTAVKNASDSIKNKVARDTTYVMTGKDFER